MVRRTVSRVALLLLLATAVGFAQQAAPPPSGGLPPDAPSKEEVKQFLEVMRARKQVEVVMQGMQEVIEKSALESFKKKVPNATPEQLARLQAMTHDTFKDFTVDEIMDAVIPVYQRHFTKQDLAASIAFYSSPSGQRILDEMPGVMREAMQVGQQLAEKKMDVMMARLDKQMDELYGPADKTQPNQSTKQK